MADEEIGDIFPQILAVDSATDASDSTAQSETEVDIGLGLLAKRMLMIHRIDWDAHRALDAIFVYLNAKTADDDNYMYHAVGRRGLAAGDTYLSYPGVLFYNAFNWGKEWQATPASLHYQVIKAAGIWAPPGVVPWASRYISGYGRCSVDDANLRGASFQHAIWYTLADVVPELYKEFMEMWGLTD